MVNPKLKCPNHTKSRSLGPNSLISSISTENLFLGIHRCCGVKGPSEMTTCLWCSRSLHCSRSRIYLRALDKKTTWQCKVCRHYAPVETATLILAGHVCNVKGTGDERSLYLTAGKEGSSRANEWFSETGIDGSNSTSVALMSGI